ncbi:kinase-like domain-containing protein [Phycomyces nitens]|nr:kinase-like domain-containing protein [Phycomyces nitens]
MKALPNTINDTRFADSSADSSSEGPNKFWARPQDSPELTLKEYSDSGSIGVVFGHEDENHTYSYPIEPSCVTNQSQSASRSRRRHHSHSHSHNHSHNHGHNHSHSHSHSHQTAHPVAFTNGRHHLDSKRHQTKMLLVSLIESFCRSYGDTPEANHKVFFLICQTLSSFGIIDSEFVDEVSSARSSYNRSFQNLFYTAVQTVRKQDFWLEDQQRMITQTPWLESQESKDASFMFGPPRDDEEISSSLESKSTHHSDLFFNLSIQNSRYRNDFVEVDMLGKGGFASAWRARNKLDDIEYAVKKIRLGKDLDDDGINPYERIFRESKNLARLEHHNVVRYYSSWLEYTPADISIISSDEGSCDEFGYTKYSESSDSEDSQASVFNGQDPTFDDSTPTFSPVKPSYEDMSQIDFVQEVDQLDSCDQDTSVSRHPDPQYTSDYSAKSQLSPRPSKEPRQRKKSTSEESFGEGWTLFIQMQLCPTTLHEYIRFRNKKYSETNRDQTDSERNIEIFSQILEGAAYIHGQGLIHRDLKPSNIFLGMPTYGEHRRHHIRSTSTHEHGFSYDSVLSVSGLRECMWEEAWVPKIGDFGLASAVIHDEDDFEKNYSSMPQSFYSHPESELSRSVEPAVSTSLDSSDVQTGFKKRPRLHRMRTSGVGTRTYASPEQLAHPPQAYDEKSDIYSLGIIFFELCQPFVTAMERADAIDNLKRGIFPEGFVEKYPKESAIILWMMDEKPAHRPSAMQLLEFELFAVSTMYTNLQAQLQAKSHALDTRNREMALLRDEMERIEREKQKEMSIMQRRLEELQRQLDHVQLKDEKKRHFDEECQDTHESKKVERAPEDREVNRMFSLNHQS